MVNLPESYKFKVRDVVTRGETGTVLYEVIAVITTSRIPRYDLRSMGALSRGKLFLSVNENKLKLYRENK